MARYPRTSHTSTTPRTAEAIPTTRNGPSAVSSTCAMAFFAAAGAHGEDQPLDHEHEAERDDEIRHAGTTGRRRAREPRRERAADY